MLVKTLRQISLSLNLYISVRRKSYQNGSSMLNAYFRYHDGADQFQLSFHYRNKELGVDRQFNFSRQMSETVAVFLSRVTANVEKVVRKKSKKKNPKKDSSSPEETALEIKLLHRGQPLSGEEQCSDVIFRLNDLSLKVIETEYSVCINAPWVSNIALPICMMAGFPVYPNKLELLFVDVHDCQFSWYKCTETKAASKVADEWECVGTEYFYTPSNSDIGHKLKLVCIPGKMPKTGPPSEVVSNGVVEAGPGICPFEERHLFTAIRLPEQNFRVVSYNILADLYADSDTARNELFPYCPPYALAIDYRKQLILKELLGYNADLICLQEVDTKVFDFDLVPVLSSVGYCGVHHKKGGTVNEGVACLFHISKFKLLDSVSITLAEEMKSNILYSDVWNNIKHNETFSSRFLERTTSLQVVVLQSVEDPEQVLIVGNTHLYFHPDADHIRLLQGGMVVMYVEYLVEKAVSEMPDKKISALICGDFNSVPQCGIFQLYTKQFVSEDCVDWVSKPEEAVKDLFLAHSLPLASAYDRPAFTNFTDGFADCLDYIFFQENRLKMTQAVPLPSEEELRQNVALPSIVFPSDHLALVADFKWKSSECIPE